MKNAGSLEEGKKVFEEVRHRIPPYSDDHAKPFTQVKHWKAESEAIKTVLDNGNASAQKMTTHGEVNDTDRAFPQNPHFFPGGQGVCCQHQEVGNSGQSHQGMDHKDGGTCQNVGRPSR